MIEKNQTYAFWKDIQNTPGITPLDAYRSFHFGKIRTDVQERDPGLYFALLESGDVKFVPSDLRPYLNLIKYIESKLPNATVEELVEKRPDLYRSVVQLGLRNFIKHEFTREPRRNEKVFARVHQTIYGSMFTPEALLASAGYEKKTSYSPEPFQKGNNGENQPASDENHGSSSELNLVDRVLPQEQQRSTVNTKSLIRLVRTAQEIETADASKIRYADERSSNENHLKTKVQMLESKRMYTTPEWKKMSLSPIEYY